VNSPDLTHVWYDLLGLSFCFPRSRTFGRWRMGYFDGQADRRGRSAMASCLLVGAASSRRQPYSMNVIRCSQRCRLVQARQRCRMMSIWYTPACQVGHKGGATVKSTAPDDLDEPRRLLPLPPPPSRRNPFKLSLTFPLGCHHAGSGASFHLALDSHCK